jgi:hypothetical protein
MRKIEELIAGLIVVNGSSHRNLDGDRLALMPRAITALAMAPALRGVFGIETEMNQRIAVYGGNHADVAAAPAIPAAGTTARNVLLAPEREAPVAAVARLDGDSNFIYKH